MIFFLMLFLILLIATTAYVSFLTIRNSHKDMQQSTEIGQHVLEMDRGQERARRLLDEFFLHYQTMGLQKAHEQYAQPSIRQIAQVISLSRELKQTLFHSNQDSISRINQVDVNLYLASSKRFADTSISAIELLSRRAAPVRGIEAQLYTIANEFKNELKGTIQLESLRKEVCSLIRRYQISRKRHLMQSAYNSLNILSQAVSKSTTLQNDHKERIFTLIHSCRNLGEQLLTVDREIFEKMRDFSIQSQIISPVSRALIEATNNEIKQAQQRIDRIHRLARIIILTIALIAIMAMSSIVRLLDNTITGNILKLTKSANEFGRGDMDVRASEQSKDELGQLASIFNNMASQVQDFVNNLEQQVAQRTAALSESEERFRNLVNDLPKIAVQGYDHERRVIYWNRASTDLYGFSEQEALGLKLEDLIIPEQLKDNVTLAVQNWYENDIAVPASELILRHKNGHDVPVYSSHVMLLSNQGKKTMYCVDIDLADLKFAQAMTRRNESLYRQLFNHSTSGVAVYEAVNNGQDFIFKDLNKAGEAMDRVSRNSLLGRRVTDAFPGTKNLGLLTALRHTWKTGEPVILPDFFYHDDELQCWRKNQIYKVPSGEIVSVFDDLTKEKQLEEEKHSVEARLNRAHKMEAIGLMAGGVAHDLNNILSGITGYPELLLLQLPKDSELRQPIEAIKESGKRAADVVADLLTVARGVAIRKETVNMNTLVMQYLDSPEYHQLHASHPHIHYSKTLSTDLPNLSCSPLHIKKCIMNLVTNAAEAMDKPGSITLSTTTVVPGRKWARENGMVQNEYIVLTITDTGAGIPQENIDHIFEPFYTKKVMGRSGTGLGLAVVWNTVEDHDGKIFVESSDKGTRFQLYFPISDAENIVPPPNDDTPREYIGNGEHILVVDDEPVLRDIACQMLQSLNYTVDFVSSGELAIDFLKKSSVDLLILDMLMDPGINGCQTYKEILRFVPGQKAIIVSGFSESDDVLAALALGASDFIKKPYSMNQLGCTVQDALNSSTH